MQYACSASTWRHPGHEPLGGNMGAALPDFGVASGEAFFFGNSSRNLLSSSSVNPLAASDLCLSLAESAASSFGDRTICGVRKITSSVLESLICVRLKKLPSNGISPSKGILVSVLDLEACIMPPMTTVTPSGVT